MGPGLLPTLVARLLLAFAMLFAAAPAAAAEFAPGSQCHAGASLSEDYAAVAADPARWICGHRGWSIDAQRVYIRFDLTGARQPPERFATRIARFTALHLLTIEASGRIAQRTVTLDAMTPAQTQWHMSTSLPGDTAGARAVVAAFDQPRFAALLTQARLGTGAEVLAPAFPLEDLALAAILGLLVGPLLFNLVFCHALRESFLLWQALVVALMIVQTAIASGIAYQVTGLPLGVLVPVSILSFCAAVAAAAMFSASFIEADKLDARHRRALQLAALLTMALGLQYVLAPEAWRAWAPRTYFAGFIPVLGVFGWTMWTAVRRRSRAALFQLAAWAPLMLIGSVRIGFNAFSTTASVDAFWAQHIGIMIEVTIAALGVADRVMTLRAERDRARREARVLAGKADHDVLTGLMNRRGLEQRFATLREDGFTTMAALDLDHFKAINDTHGHATGDAVLRAVAEALASDVDTVVARYGGEEFLILLRGSDTAARAERRRTAIPARVAASVPGLERMVTASMGLVEQSREVARGRDLAALFAHCDRLLYEAKRNGRNRTMSERLQGFAERRGGDRRKARVQAA